MVMNGNTALPLDLAGKTLKEAVEAAKESLKIPDNALEPEFVILVNRLRNLVWRT
jgi:hypothetical protein